MTGEGLHAKSDIAAQLAWRDREIDRLRASQPQQPAPAEPEHVSHSLGGFRGGFESLHGRPPTEQEIWNAAIRSWRDLNPAAAVQPPVLPPEFASIGPWVRSLARMPEPGQLIVKRWDHNRAVWAGYYHGGAKEASFDEWIELEPVRGTGSVPPSANLDVHPAQRSTQGARTEGAD
jgi:hypothetical protein